MQLSVFVKIVVFCAVGLGPLAAQAPDVLIDISTPLFEPSELHTVNLTISETDWQTLKENYTLNTYYPGTFEWAGHVVADNVGIRSRGSASRMAVKPSLKIAFDQYVSGRKVLGQKSVILLNMSQDPPMLREYLSMQMFRRAGLAAPRDAFARVNINGSYLGLFVMTEDIDTPFLARTFHNSSGWLYEYKLYSFFHFEDLGTDPSAYEPVPFELKTNKKTPNTQALIDLVQALNSTTSDTFVEDVSGRIDINRFLRHVAVEIYLGEIDGLVGVNGMNNFYLYQPGSGSDLFQVIAWDKGCALNYWDYPIWVRVEENVLLRTAMQVPKLRERFLQHLREINELAGGEGGWLWKTAWRAIELTAASANEDQVKPYTNQEYEDGVKWTLFTIQARYGNLDEQLRAEGQ
jgi:spore coat protein CotH